MHLGERPSTQSSFERTFSHHTAAVGDVNLHYVVGGEGDPVVLIHGWPTTWFYYRRVLPSLAERYTVIAPDLRGAGDSSKPLTGYDKKTLAEDIGGLVHRLGFDRVSVVGHDIGGMVAYALAATQPDVVRKLAILDVPLPGVGAWEQIKADPRAWHFYFHQRRDVPEALVSGRERMYITAFLLERCYNPAAFTKEAIDEYVRCYSAPGSLRAGFEYYRAFPEDEKDNQQFVRTKLEVPMLALGGEISAGPWLDKLFPDVAKNLELGIVSHAGHYIAEENPEEVSRRILAFLDEAE